MQLPKSCRTPMLDTEEIPDELPERPWIDLRSTYDIEAWMDNYNRELRYELERAGVKLHVPGYGICFRLEHGGDIYMQTDTEGNVMLDVTPEAEWVAPLIAAATQVAPPPSRLWALPSHVLTQLVFGLNPLIATTRIVLKHKYK